MWSQEGRAVRPASPRRREPGGLMVGLRRKEEMKQVEAGNERGGERERESRRLLLALGRYSMTSCTNSLVGLSSRTQEASAR